MKHVLIVDDDRTTVRLLTLLLEIDGYQVSQSPRPQSALELARKSKVDIFIIDGNLAGYSGLDLLREIRADSALSELPVIVTSGKDLSKEALKAGANAFLLKPFSTTVLTEKLAALSN